MALQHLPFQKKIALFFAWTVVVLTGIFCAIFINNRYLVGTASSIAHAQDILLHTEELRTQVDEIHNGVQSYIITGEEKYLQMPRIAGARIDSSLFNLRALTQGSVRQQARLDALDTLIGKIIMAKDQLVTLRKEQGFAPAQRAFADGADEADDARRLMVAIQDEEDQRFAKSKASNVRSIRNSSIIVSVFIAIMVLLLVAAYTVIVRNTQRRNDAEEEIRNINRSLEQLVDEKARAAIEQERHYRFLVENMREGIQIIDFDWRYRFVNKSVVEQSQLPKDALLGHTMMERYPGIERSLLFSKLQRCMKDRIPELFENEFAYTDGNRRWFELSVQPVPEGVLILSVDVTDRKKAEAELTAHQLRQQKLITATAIKVQEKERNELGRELHDNINQIQATIKLYLEMARNGHVSGFDPVQSSYEYINLAIEETRKLSHSLVAPSLGEMSLDEVLHRLAVEASLSNDLCVEFVNHSKKQVMLDKNKELMLYRIAQEQITNIRKYAKAQNARLVLDAGPDQIVFSISDNGVGFDPDQEMKGIGLRNIRNRVAFYSGQMKLHTAPGKGCVLEIIVPSNESAA